MGRVKISQFLYALVIVGVLVVGVFLYLTQKDTVVYIEINDAVIRAAVADTVSKQKRGLSGRKFLEDGAGMLFVHQNEGKHPVWMARMKFPLDIIWIDSDMKISHIHKNAQRCIKKTCKPITPPQNSRYVLETTAGWVEKNTIQVGDVVKNF